MNWIDAIRGTQKTTSPFEYSAKLNEIIIERYGPWVGLTYRF